MKGSRVYQFAIGDFVSYPTWLGKAYGSITKLHKSCTFGVAEIKPTDGSRKRRRKLQYVNKEAYPF